MNLRFKANDRWTRDQLRNGADVSASVRDHTGFSRKDQSDRPPRCADVDRLKVGVEHQYGVVHKVRTIGTIIHPERRISE